MLRFLILFSVSAVGEFSLSSDQAVVQKAEGYLEQEGKNGAIELRLDKPPREEKNTKDSVFDVDRGEQFEKGRGAPPDIPAQTTGVE